MTLIRPTVRVLGLASCVLAFTATAARAADTDANATVVIRAKVVAYSSGTAFAVLDATEKLKRVKLAGVDAPEKAQPFAAQAKQLAAQWLSANPIDIVVAGTDKDQRILGRITVDGRDVGLALIEAGLAWCNPGDAPRLPAKVRETYWQACARAKSQRHGLWQDSNPVPPWEQRKIPQFDPLPGSERLPGKSCREIGNKTLQCDDGKTYRSVGNQVIGSDGTVYSQRENTLTGSDGNYFEQHGRSIYGSDGSVCRVRGRRLDCF